MASRSLYAFKSSFLTGIALWLTLLPTPAQADLKGYWSLDEGMGTDVFDGSGNNHNGTLQSNAALPNWTSGFTGKPGDGALNFAGGVANAGPRVDLGDPAGLSDDITGSRTISFWFNPTSLPAGRYAPYGKSYSAEGTINVASNGSLQNYWGPMTTTNSGTHSNHLTGANTLAANQWFHVLHVRDEAGMTQQFVVNNVSQGVAGWTSHRPTGNSSAPFLIGNGYTGAAVGVIDDFAIWDEALSLGEVAALFYTRTNPANPLYINDYDVSELDQLFDVFASGGSETAVFELPGGGDITWSYHENGDNAGLDLGEAALITGDFRFSGDTGIFLLLEDGGFGVLGLQPPPLTPEPATLSLFGIALCGMGGFYWSRRHNAA